MKKTLLPKTDFRIALVGNPNVGKSVLFGLLTGKYAIVSNYPGTTVEVSKGICSGANGTTEVVDTPGANSLIPRSEDERVARDILLEEGDKKVIQVVDAKNLRRGLLLTSQLAEMGLPVVLDLNMWDESLDRGITINTDALQKAIGTPVIKTVATEKRGINTLINSVSLATPPRMEINYGAEIENAVAEIERILPEKTTVTRRALALMLLSEDEALENRLKKEIDNNAFVGLLKIKDTLQERFGEPLSYIISKKRSGFVDNLISEVVGTPVRKAESSLALRRIFFLVIMPLVSFFIAYKIMDMTLFFTFRFLNISENAALVLKLAAGVVSIALFSIHLYLKDLKTKRTIAEILGRLTMHPVAAFPILLIALWVIYKIVGEFGAGDCVDFLEEKIFGSSVEPSGGFNLSIFLPFTNLKYTITHINFQGLNYYLALLAEKVLDRNNFIFELFLDEHAGLIRVGLTYAVAIVFPIVGFFFLAFGIMEDSGYLPRLAVMVDKIFKKIGLNGKAVLPMVLGLGCDTMATLTTRILNTKKERIIATLLLALAIPCSAQLGVISGILGRISGSYFAIYVFVIGSQLLLVGYLASKILPGEPSDFLMEIPPFRMPKLTNILIKTAYRVKWFLKEAVPLFILGTFGLFIFSKLGILKLLEKAGEPIVQAWLGLPPETTEGFILGFLRRDYGAVSIFKALEAKASSRDLLSPSGSGGIDPSQLLVALVVITLFVPCLANFLVMIKEQGAKNAFLMVSFIIPFAFLVGGVLRLIIQLW
ncbi:MAG: ferrous iron transport protein B [Planctomycetes bacterium]|nr:ferrous iron transport protein B [Planctomycetota bacterium]